MWLLEDSNGKLIYLKANEVFTIGRKTGSLVVSDDSVSRNHAAITVTANKDVTEIESKAEPLSICKIADTGSKYGSYILRKDTPELRVNAQGDSLQHMDKIRFGVQSSVFTVTYMPVITAISGLDKNEKNELREIMDTIDGRITLGWEAICTHMTISKPNISEKLTCALAFGIPIVPMDFWRGALRAFQANEKLPDFEEFAKSIDGKLGLLGNISVSPNARRRTLFRNLTFVHYDSGQYNVHRRMIESAGGTSVLCRHRGQEDIDVCDNNVVVVQLVESNTTQATGTGDANYMAACEQLGKCGRRAVPSSEIALAIFHCSTKKCCNPRYDHAGMFKKSAHSHSEASSLLALDTQDVDLPPGPRYKQVPRFASKPPAGKSPPWNDIVKESIDRIEQANEVDSQLVETIPKKPCDNDRNKIGANTLDDSTSQFDEASMKVTSLNYGRFTINESNVDAEAKTNPMKRGREEEDDNDDMKKRFCDTDWENFGKKTTSKKTEAMDADTNSDTDWMNFGKKTTSKNTEAIDADTNSDTDWMNFGKKTTSKKTEAIDADTNSDTDWMNFGKKTTSKNTEAMDADTNSDTDWMNFGKKTTSKKTEAIDADTNSDTDWMNFGKKTEVTDADTNSNSIPKKLSVSKLERQKTKAPLGANQVGTKRQSGESDGAGTSASMSEDQPPLRDTDQDGRVQPLLLRDGTKGPFQRTKTARSSPTKKSKLPEQPEPGQITLTKFLSPTKKVTEKIDWTSAGKCHERRRDSVASNANSSATDMSFKSRSSYATEGYEKIHDPNASVQPLLRTESPTHSSALCSSKFGKNFRKGYTANLRRIEFNDLIDARSWSKDNNVSNKHSFHSERAIITPRKISPSSSNKMFRL